MRKRVRLVLGAAALALSSAACNYGKTQNSLKPQSPYAQKIYTLFAPVFWIAVAVFVIVEGVLLFFLIKYRHRRGRDEVPPQVHGNTRLEIAWTILPALILAGVAVPTVGTIWTLAQRPTGNVVNVTVVGHQWWWEYDYTDPGMQVAENTPLRTANELHIPVGVPVYVALEASPQEMGGIGNAVIHSFWVPELSGTQDVVPGRTNHLTLEASHPGTYSGQCKEYCGLSHANMRIRVVAQTQTDFDAWAAAQKADAAVPNPGSLEAQGRDLFIGANGVGGQCIACHTINGLQDPNGNPLGAFGGPNLTHVASRSCFAGCIFEMTPANLKAWLADPPARKPGSFMPNYHLTPDQIDALVAYLMSLK